MECEAFVENGQDGGDGGQYPQYELLPLDAQPNNKFIARSQPTPYKSSRPGWKGPLKAVRLLVLVAVLPALLIAVPLYMRYYVFSGQMYPIGMSDMRLIDKKVSTTWCQRQLLHSNASFKAFLMPEQPTLAAQLVPVSMTRHLSLDDDMKEYWGFYLLQGSIVTVSTCVRWQGASLIMIRGHKHLQECAYIGDDSSEEQDELDEINAARSENNDTKKNSTPNRPNDMIRLLGGVQFHKPRPKPKDKANLKPKINEEKELEIDTKALETILGQIRTKKHKNRTTQQKHKHIVSVPQLTHRYRDTNVNEEEEKFLSFKDLETPHENNDSEVVSNKKTFEVESHSDKTNTSDHNDYGAIENTTENQIKDSNPDDKIVKEIVGDETKAKLEEINDDDDEHESSTELLEGIMNKLMRLKDGGKKILTKLNEKLNGEQSITSSEIQEKDDSHEASEEEDAKIKLRIVEQLLSDVLEKRNTKGEKRSWKDKGTRNRRDISIDQGLMKELNSEDERGNRAIEEGFEADGIADHHHVINETTPNDMSNSEFWSSFSSSEEALLECDGLILNLPLMPHPDCKNNSSISGYDRASLSNTVTYRVPSNGYYFFVFNSENEVQTNYIRVKFDMQKAIYDLTNSTSKYCNNSTENCAMPLSFWSTEKVVLEVPLKDNDSMWNEEYVVLSECEPRTALYIICVITVPIIIVLMAFQ